MTALLELSRPVKARHLPQEPVAITADERERAKLAARFDLVAVDALDALIALDREGADVIARGTVNAAIVQKCAISGDDLPVTIAEELTLIFTPPRDYSDTGDAEIELTAEDCDVVEYTGDAFDLGEAVAQTLGLAIDPYASGDGAAETRDAVDLKEPTRENPFAALAALKPK